MESEFLQWLRPRISPREWVRLGPVDDAALLRVGTAAESVVAADLLADGVHFRLDADDPRRIGRKALAVNLSDMAAMAAVPKAAILSICIPKDASPPADHPTGLVLAQALYEGILPLADEFDTAILGGDTNSWHGPLVINVTILGEPTERGVLRRDGAQPGDWLLVTGQFGGSRLGRQFDFTPRVREALALHARYELHAGMDCSDGLSLDGSRLAEASGCGLVIDDRATPIHPDAVRFAAEAADGRTPLEHALSDGEDFELLLAVPPQIAAQMLTDQPLNVPLTKVGEFVAEHGFWRQDDAGVHLKKPAGFWH